MKALGGKRRYSSYSFLTSALDGSEWSASRPGCALARVRAPGTHCTGGWVGPRAGLDTEARGKILCPCRGSNLTEENNRLYNLWNEGKNYFGLPQIKFCCIATLCGHIRGYRRFGGTYCLPVHYRSEKVWEVERLYRKSVRHGQGWQESGRSGMGLGTCSSGVKGNGTTTDCRLRVT
jgi:hypothetical protein